MPVLYVVATPIGNLEDISLRALHVFSQVELIAAEDTRSTRHLLNKYGIKAQLTSYHEHNKRAKLSYLIERLHDEDIALVSEAGMPGLSDPGYELIAAAIEHGIQVVPVPGPSAIISALVVSGLPTNQFLYLGFLPRRKGERRKLLKSLAGEPMTLVAFEAPHRLRETLEDALEILGERKVAVCRELTKIHEEVFRGKLSQALEHFIQTKGEVTLVIDGKVEDRPEVSKQLEAELRRLHSQGIRARDAIASLSEMSGVPKNKLYKAWIRLTKGE